MKIVTYFPIESEPKQRLCAWNSRFVLLFTFLCVCFFLPLATVAQDLDARSPQPVPVVKQQRKADKKKAKQQAELDKAIRKGKKQHEKLQSKTTRKMMKKSRRKSKRWNDNRR